jgi:hypothetical protein
MDNNLEFIHAKITIKSSSKYMMKDCSEVKKMMTYLGIRCNITPFEGKDSKNGCEIEYLSALGIPARRSVEHVYNEMQYNFLPMDTCVDITLDWKGCIKKLFELD